LRHLFFFIVMSSLWVPFDDLPRAYLGHCPLDVDAKGVADFAWSITDVGIQGCTVIWPRRGGAFGGKTFARIDTKTPHDALRIIAYAEGARWGTCKVTARPVVRRVREMSPEPVAKDLPTIMAAIETFVGGVAAAGLAAALNDDTKMLWALAAYPCFLTPYADWWRRTAALGPCFGLFCKSARCGIGAHDSRSALPYKRDLLVQLVRALLPLHPRCAHLIAEAILTGQTLQAVMGQATQQWHRTPPKREVVLEALRERNANRKQQLLRELMRATEYEYATGGARAGCNNNWAPAELPAVAAVKVRRRAHLQHQEAQIVNGAEPSLS